MPLRHLRPLAKAITAPIVRSSKISSTAVRRPVNVLSRTRAARLMRLTEPAHKEIVQAAEHACDIPTPDHAFNQAEKEARPAQKREAGKEQIQRAMLNRRVRPDQIAQDANDEGEREEAAQRATKHQDRDRAPFIQPRERGIRQARAIA